MKIKGLEIEIAIAEKGLNRNQFCKISGIKPQTLSKLLKTNNAKMLTMVKIAKALGTPVTDFIVREV